jgi:hypothetical protein
MLTKMLIVSIMVTLLYSDWRWANDSSDFTHDKEAHLVGSAGAYFFFRHKDYTELESIRNAFFLGLAKETIDALLPWEKHGSYGGDGFSKYDLYYDIAGIGVAFFIDRIWKPKEKNNGNIQYRFSTNWVSISYRLHW